MKEATPTAAAHAVRERDEIAARHKWNLGDIFASWEEWEQEITRCRALMDAFVALKGTIGQGPERMLEAYQLNDQIGMMAYKIFRFPQLSYDTDQRNNELLARIQKVQNLFAEFATKSAWFQPELVALDEDTVLGWVDGHAPLNVYRFSISEVFRQRAHLLNEDGERLLSYFSRFHGNPGESYRALSTADVTFNTVELSDGSAVEVSHAAYTRLLRTCRNQSDRRKAFEAMYQIYADKRNTYASLYNGICQRGAASARARHFEGSAHAALDGNNVPVSVLETLVETAAAGVAPLQRYHALRKKVLGLEKYDQYDGSVPLVEIDLEYDYDAVAETIIASVAPLGEDYQAQIRTALEGGWIDVYETKGKRSGAYSAGVYGVHPYMLLNYNGTLSDVFTLAHELGHTMHTLLANESQPFATADYTIFVAEVASTLNEALLLDYMLGQTNEPLERAVLLQRAIDGIVGTFYMQALFADYELQAHRLAEQDQPITAEVLSEVYFSRLKHYLGDVAELDPLYAMTWARIPHFFNAPFYVYQYATCYASSAKLVREILDDGPGQAEAVERYLNLLRAGGSDHPMELLKAAGVDLSEPSTVEAVVTQLDTLVGMLEAELDTLGLVP